MILADGTEKLVLLADIIDFICRSIDNHSVDYSLLHTIFEGFKQQASKNDGSSYSILKGPDVMPAFILNTWTFRDNVEDNRNNLSELSRWIRATFTTPSGKQITEKQIVSMFNVAENKFLISERFLLQAPIDILLVNNTCCHANSLYYINSNPNVVKKDLIVLTHVSDERVQPEFVFLHELGHMVHTRITQKEFVAPRSFDVLHPLIFKYSRMDPAVPPKRWLKKWFSECFSECFAIAVLHRSPYSELDYYTQISDEDKDFIGMYMDVLFATLDYNKLGKRTWEELIRHRNKQINQGQ